VQVCDLVRIVVKHELLDTKKATRTDKTGGHCNNSQPSIRKNIIHPWDSHWGDSLFKRC